MAKEVEGRLDAAMQALQASLLVDDSTRHEGDVQHGAEASGIEGQQAADAALLLDDSTASASTIDLAELSSLSDAATAPGGLPVMLAAGVVGVAAIVVAADDDDDIEIDGNPTTPTDPTGPTDPTDTTDTTDTTDPTGPTDPTDPTDLANNFDLLGDNPDAGTYTISGTEGEVDIATFNFQVVMDQARSGGVGQVFNIQGFDAAEGDRIQFVQTDGGSVDLAEFISIVGPASNGFADTVTYNFLNASGGLSSQIVANGSFDPPADPADPYFNLIDVV